MTKRDKIRELLQDGELYGITATQYDSSGNVAIVEKMIRAGLKIIQYRDKTQTKQSMFYEIKKIRHLTQQNDVILIVNDHVDLCQAVDADGVHLGQNDLPVDVARKILGKDKIIGFSTHNSKQGKQAEQTSADYIGVGPVFKTTTKLHEPIAGLEYACFAAQHLNIPHVALGGITEANLEIVLKQGIRSVCLVKDLLESEYLDEKVIRINTILKG